ncbi:hypothetical protein [Janibacter anophelis]|uniref:hypothetical protein n=1 Tax=Janibacter anophelis TaxID=319054 RepID=UPI0013B05629|nr:hypothetical protein [Janibacter anophelis]
MGFHVPPGSLDNLTAALTNGATDQLVEIAYLGDSTGYGSGPDLAGGPPRKLRSLLLGAGLADGGMGSVRMHDDTSVATTYSDGGKVYGWPPNGMAMSMTAGETYTATGSGTAIRVVGWNLRYQTYRIDGAAAQAFTSTASGIDYAYFPGLSAGPHTIEVSVATGGGGGVGVTVEFLNAAGVVVHQDSVSGGTSVNYSAYIESKNAGPLGNNGLQYGLGKAITAAGFTDWRSAKAASPAARNVKAAIFALGLNDMSGITSDTTADSDGALVATRLQENASLFIRMCRATGVDPIIVVPHFESDSRGWRFAGRGRASLVSAAEAHGAAWCSLDDALRVKGIAQQDNPHLSQVSYDAEAEFLFDNVLSLALPA